MPLVIARYSRVLEKNIDWSLRLCTTLKKITTQGYGIVSLLGYSIFYSPHLLYLWVQKCLGFIKIPWLKPCVKGGLLSVVNLLCNHDHTMIAMNLKQKFKLKTIKKKTSFFIHADGCNVRVRRGFAQIWCSDPFEPMVISGLSRNFGPRLPCPHSPFLVLRSSFPVLRSSFPVLRSSFPVSRFPFPFPVPRSPFLVLGSPLSVAPIKFTIPCSSFLDLRCPLSVLCWSYILLLLWYSSGQFKRFPKHHSAVSVLIEKRIFEFLDLPSIEKSFRLVYTRRSLLASYCGSCILGRNRRKKKTKLQTPRQT